MFEVFVTAHAEADLRDIFRYIATELLSRDVALAQLERLEVGIKSLNSFPQRFPSLARKLPSVSDIRYMQVDNYAVFYATDIERLTVTVLRVIYSRRDVATLLGDYSC